MFTLSTFYRSKEWERFMRFLKEEREDENGFIICEHCGKPIVKKYDCIGHHKEELTEENVNDYDISLNGDNVMLIHFKCHNEIHERFGFEKQKKVYIVYGSPCAGKHEYVDQIAGESDLIMNIDSIYQCISVNRRYANNKRLSRNVFAIRDCILDMVRTRAGKWQNAFIIGGYPYENERARLVETMGAETIYIESTLEECLQKNEEEERGQQEYIKKWFDSYIP